MGVTDMEKDVEIFREELDTFELKDHSIEHFLEEILPYLPEYFWMPNEDGSENFIITHTKIAIAFANTLFKTENHKQQFNELIRDEIRAAILLHDGLIFLEGQEKKIQKEHPFYMGEFIRNKRWENLLPEFIRNTIAELVSVHSGTFYKGNGIELRLPKESEEWFVHMCVYLASKKETTVNLPCNRNQKNGDFYDLAGKIVKEMIQGRLWDGYVYEEDERYFVYLDEQQVPVAEDLYDAFVEAGEIHRSMYESEEKTLEWYDFVAEYPNWDQNVYGNPGEFYVQDAYGTYPISDEQARLLGISW